MSSGIIGVKFERFSAVLKSFVQFLLFDESCSPKSSRSLDRALGQSMPIVHVDVLPVAEVCGVSRVQFNGLGVALNCLVHLPILYVDISFRMRIKSKTTTHI